MAKITTTGYSILAMLKQEGPVSTYELAQCMKGSFLRAIWPRAESRIYEEPKRLVREGLASSTSRPSGGRPRTEYRLTRKGRAALRRWVGEPSARFRYRSEALVKIAFAHHGSRDDLQRNVEQVRAESLADAEIYLEVAERMAGGAPLESDRAHLAALVDEFILEIIEARLRWARFATEFTREWPESSGSDATTAQTKAWWRATAKRLRAVVAEERKRAA